MHDRHRALCCNVIRAHLEERIVVPRRRLAGEREVAGVGVRADSHCRGERLEAGRGDGDCVAPRRQVREAIAAVAAGALVGGLDLGGWHVAGVQRDLRADDDGEAAADAHGAAEISAKARGERQGDGLVRPGDGVGGGVRLVAPALDLEGVIAALDLHEAEFTVDVGPEALLAVNRHASAGQASPIGSLHAARRWAFAQHRLRLERERAVRQGEVAGVGQPGRRRDGARLGVDLLRCVGVQLRRDALHGDDAPQRDLLLWAVGIDSGLQSIEAGFQIGGEG